MKSQKRNLLTIILLTVSLILVNCTSPSESEPATAESLAKYGSGSVINMPLEDLSEAEVAGLLFMREEEKLARDVYQHFYEKYETVIFSNIAASEQRHADAIKLLLEKYALTDPVSEDVKGVFVNQELQGLYNTVIALGENSLIDALKAGALIEEIDILDLKNEIENVVDNQDILLVYNNLMFASYNHLKGFVRTLSANGVTYEPQELDSDLYNEILNSVNGNGNGNGQRGYRGGRR